MIIHAAKNIRDSFYSNVGPNYVAFFLPKTFDPATLDTLTLDSIIGMHQGAVHTQVANGADAVLSFNHANLASVNRETGLEINQPRDSQGLLYRVGINKVENDSFSTALTYWDKIKLLCDNVATYYWSVNSNVPAERALTFTLNQATRVDVITMAGMHTSGYFEVFTTEWVSFVPGLVATKVRAINPQNVLSNASNLKVFTRNADAVSVVQSDIGYAVLVPNKQVNTTSGKPPMMLIDTSSWDGTGSMILNEDQQEGALCPVILHCSINPISVEV